jgi:hypothetical protein
VDKASNELLPPHPARRRDHHLGTTPLEAGLPFYTIKSGDTLASIAGATGVTVHRLSS